MKKIKVLFTLESPYDSTFIIKEETEFTIGENLKPGQIDTFLYLEWKEWRNDKIEGGYCILE